MKKFFLVPLIALIAMTLSSILLPAFPSTFAQSGCDPTINLVRNGSFENPVVSNAKGWNVYPSSSNPSSAFFTPGLEWFGTWLSSQTTYLGHTRPGTPRVELMRNFNGWSAYHGSQFTELDSDWDGPDGFDGIPGNGDDFEGEPSSVGIRQTVTVAANQQYELSFRFSPRPGAPSSEGAMRVNWNGAEVALITTSTPLPSSSQPNWVRHSRTVAGPAGGSALLEFVDAGLTSNSLAALLDDVRVNCIAAPSQPDLVVSAGPTPTPSSPTVNQAVTFSGTVRNQGTGSASASFRNRFRIFNSSGTIIYTFSRVPINSLAAGSSLPINTLSGESWTPPSAGTYRIELCADNDLGGSQPYAIAESNEDNNCSAASVGLFTVNNPPAVAPDLTAENVAGPSSATVGQVISYSGQVRNSSAGGSVNQTFTSYLRVRDISSGSIAASIYPSAGPFNPGAISPVLSGTWTPQATHAGRTFEVRLCADRTEASGGTTGVITESDEGNNCSSAPFTFTVNSAPPSGTGSITICKLYKNATANRYVKNAQEFSGGGSSLSGVFGIKLHTEPNISSPTVFEPSYSTENFAPNQTFFGDSAPNAECKTVSNLTVETRYWYPRETVFGSGWRAPLYHDGYTSLISASDFDEYEDTRWQSSDPVNVPVQHDNSDGHIFLTASTPNRLFLVLNTFAPPATPPSFNAQTGTCGGYINLSWGAISGSGVTYDIYRSTLGTPGSYSHLISGIVGTSYTDLGTPGTTYYYQVRASISGIKSAPAADSAVASAACAPFDYTIANSGNQTVTQGQVVQNTVTITRVSGTPATVTLQAFSSLGVSMVPGSCTPNNTCSSLIQVPTDGVAPGSYTVTIAGNPLNRSTSFQVTIVAPAPQTGDIRITRTSSSGTPPAGQVKLDAAAFTTNDHTFTGYPINSQPVAYSTDVANYTEWVGVCDYVEGGSACMPSTFTIEPVCSGGFCSIPLQGAIYAGRVTRVVFQYVVDSYDFRLSALSNPLPMDQGQFGNNVMIVDWLSGPEDVLVLEAVVPSGFTYDWSSNLDENFCVISSSARECRRTLRIFTNNAPGTYRNFTVTGTGESGTRRSVTFDVRVGQPSISPISSKCYPSKTLVRVGEEMTWIAEPFPPGNYSYLWIVPNNGGDDGDPLVDGQTTKDVTTTYLSTGVRTVNVTVRAGNTWNCSATVNVTSGNPRPRQF